MQVSLVSLVLPIIVSSVALFFASFLSWMVLPFHRKDWVKLEKEDDFLEAVRKSAIPRGSYMFPCAQTPAEMKSEEHVKKWESGPCGVITVFPKVNMGRNLGLQFLYLLVVSFFLAYLAALAIQPGADFMTVFRFVSTAAFMAFLAGIVQHAIWFHARIVGHVIESVAYAAIAGAVFAALWPGT
ncbi:MAG: hypothetical protein WD847_21225 [Pirellulales bacterium]